MPHLKKYLTIAFVVASILLTVGCASSQVAEEDTSAYQSESDQVQQTEPTSQAQSAPQKPRAWTDVGADQAWQLINNDNTVQIIDLRDAYLYMNKHIVGATLIPSGDLKSSLDKIDKSRPVLVYDEKGRWSDNAAEFLTENGYTKVYNLTNGISSWRYGVEP